MLGEYGGIGLPLQNHLWQPDKNWGYVQFKNSQEITDEYVKYAEKLKQLIKSAYSAAVYTQTTDVEIEVNGLMTYDRKQISDIRNPYPAWAVDRESPIQKVFGKKVVMLRIGRDTILVGQFAAKTHIWPPWYAKPAYLEP